VVWVEAACGLSIASRWVCGGISCVVAMPVRVSVACGWKRPADSAFYRVRARG